MHLAHRRTRGAAKLHRRSAGLRPLGATAVWALVACCSCLRLGLVHAAETPSEAAQRVGTDGGPVGVAPQSLLPPLYTFVQPGGYLGAGNVSLGNTTFR